MSESRSVVISIVSHNHAELVAWLLKDIERYCSDESISVILTLNVPEELPFSERDFDFPLEVVRNRQPEGFGANHNAAFREVSGEFFCILNPDLRLKKDPFPPLLNSLQQERCGVVAPLVGGADGSIEDSVRRFPTPFSIFKKALSSQKKIEYALDNEKLHVDWVAGMFMLFPSKVFAELGGFDERYFLYYEDVDLCFRVREAGHEVVLEPRAYVTHDARRSSHRDITYLRWHLSSMLRFFFKAHSARWLKRAFRGHR